MQALSGRPVRQAWGRPGAGLGAGRGQDRGRAGGRAGAGLGQSWGRPVGQASQAGPGQARGRHSPPVLSHQRSVAS